MFSVKLFSYFLLCFFVYCTHSCSHDGYPYENHLSTKTPYRLVSNNSFDKISYDGCKPKKMWMIIRHGTRNPSSKQIVMMRERLPEIKTLILGSQTLPNAYIKNRDLDLFKKWKIKIDLEDDRKLTHEGEEEMLLIAERMQSRFPEIFDSAYSNTSYKFKYTHSQRTQKSAYYFASGLFGKASARDVWYPTALKKDPILRFYKLCDKWKLTVKENPKALQEKDNFRNGPLMKKVVEEVNKILELEEPLSVDDIILMYRTCAFETAWNKNTKSPWCSPFSLENFKILEYGEDLKYYWQDGYGYELTYKQACPTFGDMTSFMESKNTYPKATVYFTHSGTILKLLSHIGLHKDQEHLTANNFATMSDRKFKTSKIDSFASNLAFVLFRCGSEDKILTLHQEHIVRLPACPTSDLCSFESLTKYYSESINSCDFESICKFA